MNAPLWAFSLGWPPVIRGLVPEVFHTSGLETPMVRGDFRLGDASRAMASTGPPAFSMGSKIVDGRLRPLFRSLKLH